MRRLRRKMRVLLETRDSKGATDVTTRPRIRTGDPSLRGKVAPCSRNELRGICALTAAGADDGALDGLWIFETRCNLVSKWRLSLDRDKEPSVSQSVETPASTDRMLTGSGSNGEAPQSLPASAILFNELVLAHFRWFVLHGRYGEFGGLPLELAPAGWPPNPPPTDAERKAAEDLYHEKLAQFTAAEGEIVAAYWSTTVPSAIVMTMKSHRGRALNLLLGPSISLHRATTWLTASDSRVAELLHHCDTLGNKAAQILTHTPKRVAMTWIFSTESYLLGIVEGRSWDPITGVSRVRSRSKAGVAADTEPFDSRRQLEAAADPEASDSNSAKTPIDEAAVAAHMAAHLADEPTDVELVARGRSEIIEIEKYYDRAALNAARLVYFWGMLVGALVAGVIGLVIALLAGTGFGVIDLDSLSTRFFFACYTAGALGAIVSVLTRMRNDRFTLDYEVGRMPAFWLGTFRPFIGAVFGLFIYFALQSELLQLQEPDETKAFFFFTLFAFVAGFSERLTHVILGRAERTVEQTLTQADNAAGETSATSSTANGSTTVISRTTSRTST
jgi:hypothetical protein